MAPKRKRNEQPAIEEAEDNDAVEEEEVDEEEAPRPAGRGRRRAVASEAADAAAERDGGGGRRAGATARAEQAAEIARRRAAHFAKFEDAEAHEEGAEVHVGGENARTLGPWSSAVELVNARQQAAAARQGKLLEAAKAAVGRQEEAAWSPSRDPSLGPRAAASRVPPLLEVALRLLVTHIEDVVSLWGVPDAIKCQLAAAVCARRAMSPAAAQLFAEHAPCEVVLPNCTQLDQEAMTQLVTTAASVRLERLELGCCGRGFSDAAARGLAAAAPAGGLAGLASIGLEAAYNLGDDALGALLAAAPRASRLALPQASKLGGGLVARLPALLPGLRELDLAECRGVPGSVLASTLPHLKALRRVTLDGIPEVDDAVLEALAALPSLSALSVAFCQAVTDAGVTAAAAGGRLRELVLDDCARLTDVAIDAAARAAGGLDALSARRVPKLTDAGLAAAAGRGRLRRLAVSGVPGAGGATLSALGRCCGGSLEALDISFCRGIPEDAIGLLLDRCPRLTDLRLYGCTQVTDRLVLGHANDGAALRGLTTSVRAAV
ncbi:MAG: hypothetical protein J3K34DRAFT_525945 [Monoraphidium minutum]|nr:MAG: hypothetical protein J3K34DRAFT_525945 [Monoraphidium minutum]